MEHRLIIAPGSQLPAVEFALELIRDLVAPMQVFGSPLSVDPETGKRTVKNPPDYTRKVMVDESPTIHYTYVYPPGTPNDLHFGPHIDIRYQDESWWRPIEIWPQVITGSDEESPCWQAWYNIGAWVAGNDHPLGHMLNIKEI